MPLPDDVAREEIEEARRERQRSPLVLGVRVALALGLLAWALTMLRALIQG